MERLRIRPDLARRILVLYGSSSGEEYRMVRAEAHRAWSALGVPALIDEAIVADDIGAGLTAFLRKCDPASASVEARP